MGELPRRSSAGWRKSDRLVLVACAAMAALECAVLYALSSIVRGAIT